MLWTQDGSLCKTVKVAIGPSDGTMTEVQGEEVSEGLEVIMGEARQERRRYAESVCAARLWRQQRRKSRFRN